MAQGADHGRRGKGEGRLAAGQAGGVETGDEATGDGADIAFGAGDLPGEEEVVAPAELHGGLQVAGGVDEGVAVHLAMPHELGGFQAGDEAQDPLLLAPAQIGLKADHVVQGRGAVVLAKLDHGVGPAAGARVDEAHRLEGAKGQRLLPPSRQLFHGQTGFEKAGVLLFKGPQGDGLGGQQFLDKAMVFLFGHGTVEIVPFALAAAVTAGAEADGGVDGFGGDDGGHGVVEVEVLGAGEVADGLGQAGRGQGPGSQHHGAADGDGRHLLAP